MSGYDDGPYSRQGPGLLNLGTGRIEGTINELSINSEALTAMASGKVDRFSYTLSGTPPPTLHNELRERLRALVGAYVEARASETDINIAIALYKGAMPADRHVGYIQEATKIHNEADNTAFTAYRAMADFGSALKALQFTPDEVREIYQGVVDCEGYDTPPSAPPTEDDVPF